ncbi:hypothetical protein RF11_07800 [Thelohanellus kitauei]|uniref:Uncharacterized protein n=1 Tax=Thelohanellus kitauei TaxID=669202 RepID=A0A0C2N431_THEKT|nr:hypothetical protein RF11_07800 [Thelohanellus kitauei]
MELDEKIAHRFWCNIKCKLTETEEEVEISGCQVFLGTRWKDLPARNFTLEDNYRFNKNIGYTKATEQTEFERNDVTKIFGDKFCRLRLYKLDVEFQNSAQVCQAPTTTTESTSELLTNSTDLESTTNEVMV